MIVKRFYDEKLAQTSYLIGCAATGEALVVDANRDVGQYLAAAAEEGLRITHVTETHIHADFVSGSRELAQRSGARLYLSDEGGPGWQYAFAAEAGAVLLKDGHEFDVGNIRIRAVHTPGHTPEHLSYLVTDRAATDRPIGALTGDFLFVGDVGRPDLLERAAGMAGTTEEAARALFRSLSRFRSEQPDWLQIWPGHGAGSACGKGIGAIPQSTMGYEALTNWAFQHDDEDAFVEGVLEGQPEPPRYFSEMKRINRDGPRLLEGMEPARSLDDDVLDPVLTSGAVVVDIRPADDYAAGHVPGTLSIPLTRAFTTWAGWLIPYDADFYLIGDDAGLAEAIRDLSMVGLDRVRGVFSRGAVARRDGRALEGVERITAERLAQRRGGGEVTILDIRGAAEWEAVRIPGAVHIPLGYLVERLDEIPADRPVVVHCESGERSAIAASLLQVHGRSKVLDFPEGIRGWLEAGLPVNREDGAEAASSSVAA